MNPRGEQEYGTYGYRWVVLSVYMLVAALTQLMWLNYAPITSQTQELMGMSEFQVVLLATMFPLIYIPVSIPAGIIIDRKGYRYAIMIGAVLTAAFSFLRLFAGNYPLVLIGMIGISIGQPFVLNGITKLVSTWFPTEESALATGLGALALFMGMIVALAVTPALLEAFGEGQLSSLRWIVLIYSLAALAGLILFALLAKARPPRPPKRTEQEIVSGEVAINWKSIRTIFGLHNFRILCVIIFVGNGAFIGIMQLIEKIMEPKGISNDTAGFIGSVVVVAGVVGCIVLPSISDRIMRRKPFVLLAAAAAVPTVFLIGALDNTALIYVISGLMGFFLLSAYPVVLAFAEETTGAALTGTATGILLLLGNAGGVVLTLVMEGIKGAAGGTSGSFFWAMFFLAVIFAAVFTVALWLREPTPQKMGSGTNI
ncbi:MAG: MFS transporter [Actinomycetota bacterium]|nr:MFS transporter [Actinomycetota bacterium]